MKEYIEKNKLYKMVAEKEETARKWTLDTPTNSPAYMRYVAQLNERTAFKHMVADIPAADVVEVRQIRAFIDRLVAERDKYDLHSMRWEHYDCDRLLIEQMLDEIDGERKGGDE